MFEVNFEADCGILRSEVRGCWDVATVRRYASSMGKEARLASQIEGRLKLLAKVTDRTFASAEAASELRQMVKTIAAVTPDSRVALLVKSSFMKGKTGVQLGGGVQAFQSEHAARIWLTAYDRAQH
jgi:hypothetical protein